MAMVHHFEDASLLAVFLYLRLYLRFDLNLAFKKLATGRVTGEVTGSDIEKALQFVADNSPVNAGDFIQCLRTVKSQIFANKAGVR